MTRLTATDTAIVVLGGSIKSFSSPIDDATIICADHGAEHARQFGITPNTIIGDLDSVSNETLTYFRDKGVEIILNPDQETNDFEKALQYLAKDFFGDVIVLGMTGGRTDHTISNFSVMLRYTDRFRSLVAHDSFAEHQFLTSNRNACSLDCAVGTTLSLLPFGEATAITTHNLKYPLDRETLRLGEREGLSNVAIASPITISIDHGSLLLSVNR